MAAFMLSLALFSNDACNTEAPEPNPGEPDKIVKDVCSEELKNIEGTWITETVKEEVETFRYWTGNQEEVVHVQIEMIYLQEEEGLFYTFHLTSQSVDEQYPDPDILVNIYNCQGMLFDESVDIWNLDHESIKTFELYNEPS